MTFTRGLAWAFTVSGSILAVLPACGDDTTTGGAGGGIGGGGSGGSEQGGSGGAAADCENLQTFDECNAEPSCTYVETMAECAGSTGQSGCFWISCAECDPNLVCDPVRGGDGADGCVEAASCVMGD